MIKNAVSKERRFFEKLDRILSGNWHISVKGGALNAQSDAKSKIYLPFKRAANEAKDYPEYLKRLKSDNYHELGHCLFSSIGLEEFGDKVHLGLSVTMSKYYIKMAINRIEDERIEMWFSNMYPKAKIYFSREYIKILKKDNSNIEYIDACGRKFLPREIVEFQRKEFVKEYVKKTQFSEEELERKLRRFEELVDEYILLENSETDKMVELMTEIVQILYDFDTMDKEGVKGDEFSEGYKKPMRKSQRKEVQDDIEEEIQQGHESVEEQEDSEETEDESDDKQSGQGKETEDSEETEDEESDDFDSEDSEDEETEDFEEEDEIDQSDFDQGEEVEDEEAEETKEDDFGEEFDEMSDIEDSVEAQLQKVKNWEEDIENEIEEDVESDMESIGSGSGYDEKEGRNRAKPFNADEEELRIRKKQLVRVIKEMRIGLGASYESKQKRGKLDMRQVMNAKRSGKTKIFRKYNQDRKGKTRLGVTILVDRSGSMMGKDIQRAYNASWVIRESLEDTENKVCELAFNTGTEMIRDWNGDGDYNHDAEGGTDPTRALIEAEKKTEEVISIDREINPLVILITDGGYSSSRVNREVKKLQDMGAKVAEIVLYEQSEVESSERKETFDYAKECPDTAQLYVVMEDILKEIEEEFLSERY